MKRTIAIVLLLAMLFAFAACGEEDTAGAPYGYKLASNTEIVDYFLYVPESWVVTSATGTTMAQVSLADASSVVVTNHSAADVLPYSDTKKTLRAYLYGNEYAEAEEFSDAFLTGEGYLGRLVSLFDTVTATDGSVSTSFKLVSQPAFLTLKKGEKEIAAVKLIYTAILDGAEVEQIMVLSYEDAYFYNMTFTCAPDYYANLVEVFNGIIANFRFEP